jgi:hypothetical protein
MAVHKGQLTQFGNKGEMQNYILSRENGGYKNVKFKRRITKAVIFNGN